MAIKDTSKKPYLVDNNDNVKVGISLPFTLSRNGSGVVESTSTTIEAVKENIRNLLKTNPGERLFQVIHPLLIPFTTKIVDRLSKSERGEGGFGSTGK